MRTFSDTPSDTPCARSSSAPSHAKTALRIPLVAATLVASLIASPAALAAPEESGWATPATSEAVDVLVLRVGGTGSASSAQRYIDALMGVAAKVNGWPAARGKYFTSAKLAKPWIEAEKPEYGILSLQAYLSLRKALGLSLLGTVKTAAAGGQQYFLLSVNEDSAEGCKGKTLGTHFGGDTAFIDKVVAGEAFSLADFTVKNTRRPVKTLKSVLRGEVDCALVDDAQMAALAKLEGGKAAKAVWSSTTFPSLIVAQFPKAGDKDAAHFAGNLDKVCKGEGAEACGGAGIESLVATKKDALDDVVAKYGG